MQELLDEVISEREKSISVEFREALDFVITAIKKDYKEIEKQQQGYSKEDMEIIEISSIDANYIPHYQTKEGQFLSTKFNVEQFKNK